MEIQLLRHATLLVTFGGKRLLIDPMLSPAGALDPMGNAADTRRIPLVELPLSEAELRTHWPSTSRTSSCSTLVPRSSLWATRSR